MRVIAGIHRGRRLQAPKGTTTRPTADRTRRRCTRCSRAASAASRGWRSPTCSRGSGALGIEALSRGAGSCLFVEQDKAALDALRVNLAALGLRGEVRAGSVLALGPASAPLDLILMDPPYQSGAGAVALDRLARLGWVGPATWVSVETARDEVVTLAGFVVDAERVHGKARLTLLRRE